VVRALEKAGLSYQDITPGLPDAADAGRRSPMAASMPVSIWDPYLAIGKQTNGRILVHAA